MRGVAVFSAGFIAGMLFLLAMEWGHGSLRPVRAAVTIGPQATAPERVRLPMQAQTRDSAEEPPDLIVPVEGATMAKVRDTFAEGRGGHRHEATDIMAERGSAVLAADDGTIAKLFLSRAGGMTIYQFDPTRTWCYYYAHLDRYVDGLREGMAVRQGETIGYVGSTGDASANAPHLHFAIFRLGPEKHWWQGTAIDPYPILLRHTGK